MAIISARGRPIHFMFGYRVGFSGSADGMAQFPVFTKSEMAAALADILENSNRDITATITRFTQCLVLRWGFQGTIWLTILFYHS